MVKSIQASEQTQIKWDSARSEAFGNTQRVKSSENNLEQAENHPLHIYLPYKKYITKATKQHLSRKKEAIASVPLDKHLIKQALESLKKYEETHCNVTDLFADDGFIYAQIELSVIPEHHSIRPVQIPLPIPIYSQQYHSRFTIFSCDPEKELTDRLQHLQVPQIGEVIGYERVKKHYRENKDKLKLLASNDLFFCDWRIYNLLRQPLGKLFYEKKKFPYPIDCEQVPDNLKHLFGTHEEYLNSLGNCTYLMMGNGPSYSLKVGRVSMSPADLVKNVMRGIYRALPYIVGKDIPFIRIRQIALKTSRSSSLPIFSQLAEEEITAYSALQAA